MLLLIVLTALAVSMAIIPAMMRVAPVLGMVDRPDARKVHAAAVPRVGGIGIVAGALASALLWVNPEPWMGAYIAGSLVLLAFGAADDSRELGHYPKFIGQIAAALLVVEWGDLWVVQLPFVAEPLSPAIGKPFTVVALVGVINAINHSDGLDGLAGGETLLSLSCMAYLAHLTGGTMVVALAAAVGGGVFGFLRFNTHPAQVFMGDAGSQFLGFSLGVLAIVLTQKVNPGFSMALPALIIGLPIVDILAVLAQRIYGRMNWFKATRNHIHHRLLGIGFTHSQSVVAIYTAQLTLVLFACVLRYESDALVAGLYLAVCTLVFALIVWAERTGWSLSATRREKAEDPGKRMTGRLATLPLQIVRAAVPLYVCGAGFLIERVPPELASSAIAVAVIAAASLCLKRGPMRSFLLRLALYSGIACEVYLLYGMRVFAEGVASWLEIAYFGVLGLAVPAALRVREGEHGFRTTPLDFLMAFAVVAAGLLSVESMAGVGEVAALILRSGLLFYACELMLSGGRTRSPNLPEWSLIGAAVVLVSKTWGAT